MKDLEHGKVDLLIGGSSDKTPWESKVGLTRPYARDKDAYGDTVRRVIAVPLGENALLTALETHLHARTGA